MDDAAVEHWIDAIGLPALEQVRDRQPESLTADVRRQAARDVILTVRETRGPANPDGTRPTVFNLRLVAAIVLAEVQVWMAYGPRSWGASCGGVIRNASRSRAPRSTRWPRRSCTTSSMRSRPWRPSAHVRTERRRREGVLA